MTNNINKSEIQVAGKTVTVFEMNVTQIRAWLKDVESEVDGDFVSEYLFDDFAITDLTRMSSITEIELAAMTPSQIKLLADICKEKNESFFDLVGKRRKLLNNALGLS